MISSYSYCLSILLLFYISLASEAQTYVTIPDDNFRNILTQLIPEAFDNEERMNKDHQSLFKIKSFQLHSIPIGSLEGIQYFLWLDSIICTDNGLGLLPDWLPPSLIHIDVSFNNLTSLPPLPSGLLILQCTNNSLSDLPELPESLFHLECSNNNLSDLPMLPQSLSYLDCSNNELTNLPALPHNLYWLDASLNCLNSSFEAPDEIGYFVVYPNNKNCLITDLRQTVIALSLHPNPVTDILRFESRMDQIELFNAQGIPIARYQQVSEISMAELPTGVYLIRSGEKQARVVKL